MDYACERVSFMSEIRDLDAVAVAVAVAVVNTETCSKNKCKS